MFKAEIGDFIKPDGWKEGSFLNEADFCGIKYDLRWDFNVLSPSLLDVRYSVKVTITSTKGTMQYGKRKLRCRIEFVKDSSEASIFSSGYILKAVVLRQ